MYIHSETKLKYLFCAEIHLCDGTTLVVTNPSVSLRWYHSGGYKSICIVAMVTPQWLQIHMHCCNGTT